MPDTEAVYRAAKEAFRAGLCVLPPVEDGSKRPQPIDGSWQQFKTERPTPELLRTWYPGRGGIGVVAGGVSGDVECFDFDDMKTYEAFCKNASVTGLGDVIERIEAGYCDDTPGGGVRWLCRCPGANREHNEKLARRPKRPEEKKHEKDNVKVLIELPDYAIVAPSNGRVHPSGRPYVRRSGDFLSIATISVDEREALLELARSFDEMPRHEAHGPEPKASTTKVRARPGDDYNARTEWAELLEPAGWTYVYRRGDVSYWRRPGKNFGISATTNFRGSDLLYVFSSSTAFEQDKSYSRFAAYAVLHHDGDFWAAARALGEDGYGESTKKRADEEPTGELDEPPEPDPKRQDNWPEPMDEAAYHGIAGDFVRTVLPHTEADPAALLVQFLAGVGNMIGRGPYCLVEATEHRCNLFVGLVGRTSKGRKGTALDQVRRVLRLVDSEWERTRIASGLSSGEGLIWSVRDPINERKPIRKSKVIVDYESVVSDEGIDDKRELVVESELASVLSVIARQGNTLSPVVRNAWDKGDLESITKNSPAKATGAYISIIGHVTRDELRKRLTATETANGFANRWIWICSHRSKVLPEGGSVPKDELRALADRLRTVLVSADQPTLLERDTPAREAWARVYPVLSEGEPGLFGAATNRAEAQVLRLSLLYAALDRATAVGLPHLRAALAVWKYAEASARYIFGDTIGDETADAIDRALRDAAGRGLTRTDVSAIFGRNLPASRLAQALALLVEHGRVQSERESVDGRGRPVERWYSTVGR